MKLPLLLLAALSAAASVQAQGTIAFSYQGRLNQSGNPATGTYDLRFTIYDAVGGGAAIAGPLTQAAVGVTNGLFNVALDFGANIFTGPARWMEIGVRTNGGGAFATLNPRQPLLPTPYAIHAGTASNVVNGSVVKSLNGLRDNVSLVAGANVTLTPSGNTLTIASTGGAGVWSLNGSSTFYNAGNVGIGTGDPASKLDVRGALTLEAGGDAAIFTGTGPSELNRYLDVLNSPGFLSASGLKAGGVLVADSYGFANPGKNDLIVKGSVGIGTATPGSRLTVYNPSSIFLANYGVEHTDGNVRLSTYLSDDAGWLGTISNHKLQFYVNNGGASMTVDTSGNVGIGTTTPTRPLTVYRPSSLFVGNYGIEHTDGSVRLSTYLSSSGGWLGTISNHKLYFYVADGGASMTVDTTGNVGIGTTSPQAKLDVAGQVRTSVLTITGGADIAEPFKMSSDEIPKGSVVVIDEQNPGQLKMSATPYDTRVAGVVSGANGIKPGISLHQEGAIEGGENVALSGRVYVQADATAGAIQPGDLLTTSDTPGHAMKVGDHAKAQGAILGKAMTGLKAGKGMVLVLVTLQ